jgi:nucleotide-binding universal stress UspA family protein
MNNFETLLCAVDFSEHSLHALTRAFELARSFNSDLMVAHIIEDGSNVGNFDASVPLHQPRKAKNALETFIKLRAPKGINTFAYTSYGDPAEEILRLEKVYDIDAIIMGLYGTNGDMTKLSGSVSRKVSNDCECPVFTILHDTGDSGSIFLEESDPELEETQIDSSHAEIMTTLKKDIRKEL